MHETTLEVERLVRYQMHSKRVPARRPIAETATNMRKVLSESIVVVNSDVIRVQAVERRKTAKFKKMELGGPFSKTLSSSSVTS
jgi:hypothetical protein